MTISNPNYRHTYLGLCFLCLMYYEHKWRTYCSRPIAGQISLSNPNEYLKPPSRECPLLLYSFAIYSSISLFLHSFIASLFHFSIRLFLYYYIFLYFSIRIFLYYCVPLFLHWSSSVISTLAKSKYRL